MATQFNPAVTHSTPQLTSATQRKPPHTTQPRTAGNTPEDAALFGCSKTQPQFGCSKSQPKFGGWGRTAATGGMGALAVGSAAICLPAAAVIGLIGCIPFLHFLWPIAGLVAGIPVALGALAAMIGRGGKSDGKKD